MSEKIKISMKERFILAWLTILYETKNTISTSSNPELKTIHEKIRKHMVEEKKEWKRPKYPYYQGYDRIKWTGMRNTEKRIENYGLHKYLKKDWKVLDIGCNMGFVSIETSRFVGQVDALDVNPHIVAIGRDTAQFLSAKNVNFFVSQFEEFNSNNKYDAIFSFANHKTGDGLTDFTIHSYFKKVREYLKPDGLLFFESHNHNHENWNEVDKALDDFFIKIYEKPLVSENKLMKGRVFRILKRK